MAAPFRQCSVPGLIVGCRCEAARAARRATRRIARRRAAACKRRGHVMSWCFGV
ncbi:putative liporotein [Burkholderia mallei NCTC 10247]|nr:putative liporotein [Burkholderia mallei NCTC 10247]